MSGKNSWSVSKATFEDKFIDRMDIRLGKVKPKRKKKNRRSRVQVLRQHDKAA